MNNRKMKTVIGLLLSVAMLFSFAACTEDEKRMPDNNATYGTSDDYNNGTKGNSEPSKSTSVSNEETTASDLISLKDVKAGKYITFGSYEQDDDLSNGKEKIEWLVLDVQNGKAFVISKYILACKPYGEWKKVDGMPSGTTWAESTIRSWLNDSFYNEAFSDEEKSKILTTTVTAGSITAYYGEETNDKLFFLSDEEAEKYFNSDNARICRTTEYALPRGGVVKQWWWLRSPGSSQSLVRVVHDDGRIYMQGYHFCGHGAIIDFDIGGVRPAMWIELG